MRTLTVLLLGTLVAPALVAQAHGRSTRRTTTAGGEVALPANPARASAAVERFQQALRVEGCDPGAIDGIIGPHTAQAIACARRKGVVPSAPGAGASAAALEPDVFVTHPSAAAGPGAAAIAPIVPPAKGAPASPSGPPVMTPIPVPTVNAAHDSLLGGTNSARDSTVTGTSAGGRVPVVPRPPARLDTRRR